MPATVLYIGMKTTITVTFHVIIQPRNIRYSQWWNVPVFADTDTDRWELAGLLSYLMFQKCFLTMQGGPKNLAPFFLYDLTLPNINRLSKLFHCQNQEKICNNTVVKDPTTYATTHFKKLTTGNNVFIVSVLSKVTVTSIRVVQKFGINFCTS